MDQSATAALAFAPPVSLPLAVDFLGGRLTSDGGWVWVAEADAALGLCATLAAVVADPRRRRGRHTLLRSAAAAHLPDRRRLRGPERCRHLAPRPAAEAGLRAAAGGGSRSGQPADLLAVGERDVGAGLLSLGGGVGGGLSARTGAGRACRRASCSTWTARTIRRMASRKAAPTTATSGSTCTTRCSSSTATPGSSSPPSCAPATPTPGRGRWPSSSGWCAGCGHAGRR